MDLLIHEAKFSQCLEGALAVFDYKLPANGHKPANDHKLPANNNKPPANDQKLPANDHKRPPLHIKPKS